MANRNTQRARYNGFSDMKRLEAGGEKNYKQKTGRKLNTSALRAKTGRKAYCAPTIKTKELAS